MFIVLSLSLPADADPYGCPRLSSKPWYCFESVEVFKSLCLRCGAMPCNLGTVAVVGESPSSTNVSFSSRTLSQTVNASLLSVLSSLFLCLYREASGRFFLVDLKFCC